MKFGEWIDEQAYQEFVYGHENRFSLAWEEYMRVMNRSDRLQAIAFFFGARKYDYYNRYASEQAYQAGSDLYEEMENENDDYRERQRAGGRRQEGILIPALLPVTVGNKGLKPRRLHGAYAFGWGLNPHPIIPSALCLLPSFI
jgi:hypothetical protein